MPDAPATSLAKRRWDLVIIDLAFILIGVGGYIGSVPALQELLPFGFVRGLCLALTVLGFIAIVGVLTPQWLVELSAKLVILGGLVAYEGALLWVIFVFPDSPTSPGLGRLYVVGGAIIPMVVIARRLPYLIKEAAKARAIKNLRRIEAQKAVAQ